MIISELVHSRGVSSLLLLCIWFSVSERATAQDSVRLRKTNSFKFELLLGPTSSSINEANSASKSGKHLGGKAGYSAGIGIVRSLGRKFEIHSRVLWERKGFQETWDSMQVGNTSKHTITNDYLTISLVPQIVFGSNIRFTIGAGGYFGLLTSSSIKDEYRYHPAYVRYSFESIDYGLSFSATCSFALFHKSDFVAQLVSSRGINQVSTSGDTLPQAHNNSFSLLIGLRFGRRY